MLQKTKKTSRKFYSKWLYKVSLRVPGAAILRMRSLDDVKKLCLTNSNSEFPAYTIAYKAWNNRDQLLELTEFLSSKQTASWSKRIENTSIDFYTNDVNFYNEISTKFESSMIHRFEPESRNIDLLDQAQTIVAKKLPHNRYQYKVYLLPHKIAGDKEGKLKYVEWLKSQKSKITCTEAVAKWFIKTDWNWDRRYVLVEDDHMLLLLKLRNSEVVGRIYNYVISDK